jgi:HTH-type transcriptional regulator/antitoxin HigA
MNNNSPIKPIRSEADYEAALTDLEKVFDCVPGTPQADQAEILVMLISKYEEVYYPLNAPDPIEALKYIMQEKHLKNKDLVSYFGSKSLVSEVLNKKRELTLKMIKSLHRGLGIPYELLIA